MLMSQREPDCSQNLRKIQASTPSLLGCFGGIDVSVEPCSTSLHRKSENTGAYGRLMGGVHRIDEEEEEEEEEETEEGHCSFGLQKLSRSARGEYNGRIKRAWKMGVVKSKLKSSTRSVASKLRRACEQLVEVAHKSAPHMVDLFLSNQLLGQLSAVPSVVPYQRSFSLQHHSPPPSAPWPTTIIDSSRVPRALYRQLPH